MQLFHWLPLCHPAMGIKFNDMITLSVVSLTLLDGALYSLAKASNVALVSGLSRRINLVDLPPSAELSSKQPQNHL